VPAASAWVVLDVVGHEPNTQGVWCQRLGARLEKAGKGRLDGTGGSGPSLQTCSTALEIVQLDEGVQFGVQKFPKTVASPVS
jgi:hypothetical protein